MKKIVASMFALVLMFTMSVAAFAESTTPKQEEIKVISLTIGDETIELVQGQSVSIPMQLIRPEGEISPLETFPGNGGLLTLYATSTTVEYILR